jgi:phosphate starvation-inducible PhoH-like protein
MANTENTIVVIDGPAGSGKTFCAASWGLEQFAKGRFNRIIFTRPYVEAGENLGFLPGTFGMKIAPYMIPIFDVLYEHLSHDDVRILIDEQRIITLPLAYMRGVTFRNSFVLLDEGQNATVTQMHLFLTRVGDGSKMVITGDHSQSDIRGKNGFIDAIERLQDVPGLEIVTLDKSSIVRHPIIANIESRYGENVGSNGRFHGDRVEL